MAFGHHSKAAQVLLTDHERFLQRGIKQRLLGLGIDSAGITLLHRAGLHALTKSDDAALLDAVKEATNVKKPSPQVVENQFADWCSAIAAAITKDEPALQYAYDASQPGDFSEQGRFVLLSVMHDGRVLIGGMAAVVESLQPGRPVPRSPQLFPGGLAVTLSMNAEGADLAKQAIIAWLLQRDSAIEDIRQAIRLHNTQPAY